MAAVLEYHDNDPLPFLGGRASTWESPGRLASHARRSALATRDLRETADDRAAVTTVVASIGSASDQASALTTALDSVRDTFGWAQGSFWALDTGSDLLRFQTESGSAGAEFREVTLSASFAEGVGLRPGLRPGPGPADRLRADPRGPARASGPGSASRSPSAVRSSARWTSSPPR